MKVIRIHPDDNVAVALDYRAPVDLVLLVVLLAAGFGVGFLVIAHKLEAVALHRAYRRVHRLGEVARSADIVHIRAEDAGRDPKYREKFDLSTARAVAQLAGVIDAEKMKGRELWRT